MIMGSDQIVRDSIFEDYRPHIERGERYIGVKDLYVLDMIERSVAYWPGYVGKREGTPIGPGRLMRKDLLEELNYDLYGSTLDKGLDGSMDVRMPACVLISGKEHGMTSIKTRESITKARQYHGSTRVHYGRFMDEHFPEVKL